MSCFDCCSLPAIDAGIHKSRWTGWPRLLRRGEEEEGEGGRGEAVPGGSLGVRELVREGAGGRRGGVVLMLLLLAGSVRASRGTPCEVEYEKQIHKLC